MSCGDSKKLLQEKDIKRLKLETPTTREAAHSEGSGRKVNASCAEKRREKSFEKKKSFYRSEGA